MLFVSSDADCPDPPDPADESVSFEFFFASKPPTTPPTIPPMITKAIIIPTIHFIFLFPVDCLANQSLFSGTGARSYSLGPVPAPAYVVLCTGSYVGWPLVDRPTNPPSAPMIPPAAAPPAAAPAAAPAAPLSEW